MKSPPIDLRNGEKWLTCPLCGVCVLRAVQPDSRYGAPTFMTHGAVLHREDGTHTWTMSGTA